MKALISQSSFVVGLSLCSLARSAEIAKVSFYSSGGHSMIVPGDANGQIRGANPGADKKQGVAIRAIRAFLSDASHIGEVLGRLLMISDLGPITDMNGKKLPSGMVLSPPDFGVLVFLDGILDNDLTSMPFIRGRHQSNSSLGVFEDIYEGRLWRSNVLASAMGSNFPSLPTTCYELEGNVKSPSITLDSTLPCSDTTTFYERRSNIVASLSSLGFSRDQIPQVEMSPISENIEVLARLQTHINHCAYASEPRLLVAHLSLAPLSESPDRSTLERTLDLAMVLAFENSNNCIVQPSVVVQIVAGANLSTSTETNSMPKEMVERPKEMVQRILPILPGVGAAALDDEVPLEDIVQYQLNLWTAVGLVVTVLVTIQIIAFMDIKRDSLIYAKFSWNTQGFKND